MELIRGSNLEIDSEKQMVARQDVVADPRKVLPAPEQDLR